MTARPFKYTTTIKAKVTSTECLHLLADAGAEAIAVQFRDRQPVGISFQLDTPGGFRNFLMPVNTDGVHAMLQAADFASLKVGAAKVAFLRSREHAADVAWRVVRDWLEAQVAIIAAGMVGLDEVMIPYLEIGPGGETIRDRWTSGRLAIEA
jgi:hypothetical protein